MTDREDASPVEDSCGTDQVADGWALANYYNALPPKESGAEASSRKEGPLLDKLREKLANADAHDYVPDDAEVTITVRKMNDGHTRAGAAGATSSPSAPIPLREAPL